MTAVVFPDIVPTSRRYSPGEFPQTKFRALNGATTTLRYGNRRFNAELDVGFQNITDDQAAILLKLYEDVTVADDWVTFSVSNIAGGASSSLGVYLREAGGSGLRWRFAEPPMIDSVKPGRSTVQCKFLGVLDGV